MTNDFGEHWKLLTDGTNGIPADQPMHIVREIQNKKDCSTRTLEGAYVSFDQARTGSLTAESSGHSRHRSKVHHGDLLASTMGRSFWIMDNIAPLRQIAASVTKPRARPTTNPAAAAQAGQVGRVGQSDVLQVSMQTPAPAPTPTAKPATLPASVKPVISRSTRPPCSFRRR
jgi:hypothetical protein